ncbi:MAG: hypothetical protein ABIL58_28585 [Pseudomonadota bacterium]
MIGCRQKTVVQWPPVSARSWDHGLSRQHRVHGGAAVNHITAKAHCWNFMSTEASGNEKRWAGDDDGRHHWLF